jgi:23S rRNA (uracil1939-C5)-methyltransferase
MREIELRPTGVSSGGEAVARDGSGRVVFVPGALPGETVRVHIVSQRPKSAQGRMTRIVEPSPHRVAPPCPEVGRGCGGCPWQHVAAPEQRRLKTEIVTNALRRAGIEPPGPTATVDLPPWAYRTTLRAGVVGGRAGFRRARSHDILPVEACLVAHPLLADLLARGRYDGADEVLLRCGARTGERLVSVTPREATVDVPDDVRRRHLHELAAGRRWRISAESFFQARPDGVDALAALVAAAAVELGPPSRAVDLYSGVGVFAGVLGALGWAVTAVENAPSALGDARANLRDVDATVVGADVARWSPTPAGRVVADPSRIGLGRQGVGVVAGTGARRVVLVSCDAISLGRDAALLGRAGYALTSSATVDLFPQTSHTEVVTVYDRA